MTDNVRKRAVRILLVEDNPADIRLTREALHEAKVRNELYSVTDGIEAMQFLHRQGRYDAAPRPDMILLDLNMPRKSGREVLCEIKQDPRLRAIPVIVLTTSQAEQDILDVYDAHGNCFVTKPLDLDRFIEVIESFEQFWLTLVRLPEDIAENDAGAER